MTATKKFQRSIALLATSIALVWTASAPAQVRRYEPSRPTVSPYLNLFRFNNSVIPNYQSLVRPEQQALRFRQQQLQYDRQQSRAINQLQSNVRTIQQGPVTTELVAPTGKKSWFNVPGSSQFGDTRDYFSRAGVAEPISAPRSNR